MDPVLIVIALAAAISFWLLASWVSRLSGSIPERRGDDALLPRFWRTFSWPTHACASLLAPFISRDRRLRLSTTLRRAGLDHCLNVERLVGGQAVASVLAALVTGVIVAPRIRFGFEMTACAALLGWALPRIWLNDAVVRRGRQITRSLPFFLDILILAIEAGASMTGALQHAVDKGPDGPLADELQRVLREMRAGRSRTDALRAMGNRLQLPSVSNWVSAVLAAERQGASMGPILRSQADQRRQERFLNAEAQALKAPVKMLLPLVACIFPCTFVIVFFPIVVKIIREGLL